ncbi:MAG: hypothetical protein H7Z72_25110 [Bacteroidetes bacterium]|nr:hypothetical protein [Fibrella sp.]
MKTFLCQSLIISAGVLSGGTLLSCSGNKTTEQETVNTTVDTTKGALGRPGDTTGSDPTMIQQAPPDSAQASGQTVIEEIKVKPKR